MRNNTHDIVRRIGETDQLYLNGDTPELALERANLRLELVTISHLKQEQIHFLQEAIVLLEQARISVEEMPMHLYVQLSLHLAKAYMIFFEISKEHRYALITQQILKPLSPQDLADVYFFLAYASMSKNEPAMARHWLQRYSKSEDFDLELLQQHHAFESVRSEVWFKEILKTKVH